MSRLPRPTITGFAVLSANGRLAAPLLSPAARSLRATLRRAADAELVTGDAESALRKTAAISPTAGLREQLAGLKLQSLFCADDPLLRRLIEARLLDEIHLVLAPMLVGGITIPTLTGPAGEYLPRSIRWKLMEMGPLGDECHVAYRRAL